MQFTQLDIINFVLNPGSKKYNLQGHIKKEQNKGFKNTGFFFDNFREVIVYS